ncbi:MAG: hypothetical protein JW910_07140 [Anaerolineae bacterium]|nr:hypothetical protein [Anaerolineae bacterium]
MDTLFGPIVALARNGMARGRAAAGRYSFAAVFGLLGVIAAMAAIGLGLMALWYLLLPRMGPAGTALILAGVLALLSCILLALASSVLRQKPREPATVADPEVSLQVATQLFKEQKGSLLLAALIAGFGAGTRPPRSGR